MRPAVWAASGDAVSSPGGLCQHMDATRGGNSGHDGGLLQVTHDLYFLSHSMLIWQIIMLMTNLLMTLLLRLSRRYLLINAPHPQPHDIQLVLYNQVRTIFNLECFSYVPPAVV